MEIIAVCNIKGGVGKTTTAVNLAYLSAAAGWPTLLWDLDPQGASTYTLGGTPDHGANAKKLVRGRRELSELIWPTAFARLDLLPSDFSFRHMDVHLAERKRPTERLLRMSRPLRRRYATLILDCPPGMSLLSENVLRAADAIVVPLLPSPLSIRMLEQLLRFVEEQRWHDLLVLPFFSMVDQRKLLHRELVASTRERFPATLATAIPYRSEIERMTVRRAPLPAFAPGSPVSQLYAALWEEIDTRLQQVHGSPMSAERVWGQPSDAD